MLVKAFRLFVSSTFADFAAERDVLQRRVFPALDAYCTARGYQFHPIDLRWGVNEEAQLDQRVTEICLNEVRAAKQDYPPPNFLIMIGDRYGFVPLPYAIAEDEFDAIIGQLERRHQSDAAGALRAVYRRDDNYLPPGEPSAGGRAGEALAAAYTLRSRVDDLPELRPSAAWAARESELRAILQRSADELLAASRIDQAAHEKYFLSLTEQEIIHGLPGYRPLAQVASQPLKMASYVDGPPAIAFIRDLVIPSDAGRTAFRGYLEHEPRLDVLKDRIRSALPADHVVPMSARFDANSELSAAYLEEFAARIQDKLKAAIDRYIVRVESIERAPDYPLQSERAAHRVFALRKLEIFVGRQDALAAVAKYVAEGGAHPLVLHGPSGLGKSAVMARAIAAAEGAGGPPVVARFIGASAASSNLRALLMSIVEDLAAHGIVTAPGEFERDANKFHAQIAALLSSPRAPAVVFLDALDQLRRPRALDWLPAELPGPLRLVLSVLDDPAYEADSGFYRDLRGRLAPDAFLAIGPLAPGQARDMLAALEQQGKRRLQPGQRDYLLQKYDGAGGSPLYLRTAFEIARSWKSYAAAGAGRHVLADDTVGLIAQFVAELSSVHHHEPDVVSRTLGYLVAARDGLSAKEITDVLARDADVMQAISSERLGALTDALPPSVWVRLNRDLSPFLVEKQIDDQPLLQFFHRQVAQVARAQHYERGKIGLHTTLAAYFESQGKGREGRRTYPSRSLSEIPHQLHHAEDARQLGLILMSADWMRQKLAAFGPRPLIDDYQFARTRAQRLTGQALALAAGILERDPAQLVAQIIGRVAADLVDDPGDARAIEALLTSARELIAPPSLVPHWPTLAAPGSTEIRRFEGHTGKVNCLAFSPDGLHIVSGAGNQFHPWDDSTLRLWEAASGSEVARFEHARFVKDPLFRSDLPEPPAGVDHVAFSPDGRHIAAAVQDKTLRLRDAAGGREIARFEIATDQVFAVAFSPDSRSLAAVCYFHTIGEARPGTKPDISVRMTFHVWDVAGKREIARFTSDADTGRAIAFSPDGRHIASGSRYGALQLWEVASGRATAQFDGDASGGELSAVTFSPDGRRIASSFQAFSPDQSQRRIGAQDQVLGATLRLWDIASQRRIARFEDGTGRASAIVFTPDGRHIISDSSVWDVAKGLARWEGGQTRRLKGHADRVWSLAFSPDGRAIVSGSADRTLRRWDVATGSEIARCKYDETRFGRAVASDERPILFGSAGESVHRLWEMAAGPARKFPQDEHAVLALSPDGRQFVSYFSKDNSWNYQLRVRETESGSDIARFDKVTGLVNAVTFSHDGLHLVCNSSWGNDARWSDDTLLLWEAKTGREVGRFTGHTGRVEAIAISPDGRHVASGACDDTLRLWDLASGRELARCEGLKGLTALAFSPDGQHVVCGSEDETVRVMDLRSARELARFEGHTGRVEAVAVSPDGRLIASGSADKSIRLWEVAKGIELTTATDELDTVRFEGLRTSAGPIAFFPDRRQIVSSQGTTLHLWERPYGAAGRVTRPADRYPDSVLTIAFAPDGRRFVTSSGKEFFYRHDGTLALWDAASGRELMRFNGHTDRVDCIAFSPDGRHVVSGSSDRTLRLWEAVSGREIARFEGHTGRIGAVVFSPDGGSIVSGADDKTLRLWNVASRAELARFEGHWVRNVEFADQGRHIVFLPVIDRKIRVWEVASGQYCLLEEGRRWERGVGPSPDPRRIVSPESLRQQMDTPIGGVFLFAIAPDGRQVASNFYSELRLATVASGRKVVETSLGRHDDDVFAIAFSNDGKLLLSGSKDQTLRLWNVASRREMVRFKGHADSVLAVAFARDGRHIVSGSRDRTVRLWHAASGRELARFDFEWEDSFPIFAPAPDRRSFAAYNRGSRLHLVDVLGDEAHPPGWIGGSVSDMAAQIAPPGPIPDRLDRRSRRSLWHRVLAALTGRAMD